MGSITYTPPENSFGDNMANMTINIQNDVYTITINVLPVNDPPVLIPFFEQYVEVLEDDEVVLYWNGTDIDSPLSSLRTKITVYDTYKLSHNFFLTLSDEVITATTLLLPISLGVFGLKFKPPANFFDATKAGVAVNLVVLDDYNAPSNNFLFRIRVLPVNDPPTITGVDSLTYPDPLNQTVTDIDILRGKYSINITCSDSLYFVNTTYEWCQVISQRLVQCNVTQKDVHTALYDIKYNSIEPVTGYITIDVSDNGNTDYLNRPLYTTKTINIYVPLSDSITPLPSDNTALTIGLAVSLPLAVAAAIAAIIWKFKNKNTVDSNYFDNILDRDATGNTNPLYQQSHNVNDNPLYAPV